MAGRSNPLDVVPVRKTCGNNRMSMTKILMFSIRKLWRKCGRMHTFHIFWRVFSIKNFGNGWWLVMWLPGLGSQWSMLMAMLTRDQTYWVQLQLHNWGLSLRHVLFIFSSALERFEISIHMFLFQHKFSTHLRQTLRHVTSIRRFVPHENRARRSGSKQQLPNHNYALFTRPAWNLRRGLIPFSS